MFSDFEAVQIVDCGKLVGRGLIASRKIKKGEVIFHESPLVLSQFSWNRKYGYLACDHCMAPLESTQENVRRLCQQPDLTLPYSDHELSLLTSDSTTVQSSSTAFDACTSCGIRYCSSMCLKQAWQTYHAVLCLGKQVNNPAHPLNKLEEAWQSIHYPPETASIMLLVRMVAMVKQASEADRLALINKFGSFCQSASGETDQLTHKLLGEEFVAKIEGIRELFIAALYDDSISTWFSYDGFRQLLALVGRNSQGIATSPLSTWVKRTEMLRLGDSEKEALETFIDQIYSRMDDTVGQFMDNDGVGLYSMQSLNNHSCEPRAQVEFSGISSYLSLVALEDLSPGEPITISYLTECDLARSRHSRQRWLRENYLFVCECPRCLREVDQPDVTSDEEEEEEVEDIEAD